MKELKRELFMLKLSWWFRLLIISIPVLVIVGTVTVFLVHGYLVFTEQWNLATTRYDNALVLLNEFCSQDTSRIEMEDCRIASQRSNMQPLLVAFRATFDEHMSHLSGYWMINTYHRFLDTVFSGWVPFALSVCVIAYTTLYMYNSAVLPIKNKIKKKHEYIKHNDDTRVVAPVNWQEPGDVSGV